MSLNSSIIISQKKPPEESKHSLIKPMASALHNLFLNKDKYLKIHFYLYSISQDGTIETRKQIEVIDERYKV